MATCLALVRTAPTLTFATCGKPAAPNKLKRQICRDCYLAAGRLGERHNVQIPSQTWDG